MSANNLVEIAQDLIIAYVKTNVNQALLDVRAARSDKDVTTEPFEMYFTHKPSEAYRSPALFVIPVTVDFRLSAKGANHINAAISMHINAVVEDYDLPELTKKAFRYQAALTRLLNNTRLTAADNSVVYIVKIMRAEFSSEYTSAQQSGDTRGTFRKEVWLDCEIENYENY